MKRIWLGLGLLTVLLLLCLQVSREMENFCHPVAETLEQARLACEQDAPRQAGMLLGLARERWTRRRPLAAVFADHTPLEEAEAQFAQVQALLRSGLTGQAGAVCARLVRTIAAISEAQQLSWQNLL